MTEYKNATSKVDNSNNHHHQRTNHEENTPPSKKPSPELKNNDSFESPAPPDGGWGWVIVFASFMIHVVTDGVVYSFGELYSEFLHKYNEGNYKTSLIPSILVGTTLCSGPIASVFVNKFGCRPVTIAGSVISAFCIFISQYAENINTLIVTLGLGTGIGFGLIYLPAIVSVTCYFEKYRSVATGIGVCGSGFGTVIFAPLIKISIQRFQLEGTLILIAACVLSCVLYGALLRPVPMTGCESDDIKKVALYSPENVPLTTITLVDEDQNNGDVDKSRRYSVPDVVDVSSPKTRLHLKTSEQFVSNPALLREPHLNKSSLSLKSNHSGIMLRKDIFYTGSIKSINNISKSNGYLSASHKHVNSIAVCPPVKEEYSCGCSGDCQEQIKEMTDFSLLRDVIFVMFSVSNFLTSIGYNLPYIYIPNHLDKKNLTNYSGRVIAVVGIGNTAGRIILGYLSDKAWVNRRFVYNTCLTVCGIACLLSVFCVNLTDVMMFAFTFGFTTGAYVGLTSVITVDLFGLDKLTNAFGILLLFQGVASFIGPPLAGAICDRLHTYDPAFYLAGVTIAISGIMLYFVPMVQFYLLRRSRSRHNLA